MFYSVSKVFWLLLVRYRKRNNTRDSKCVREGDKIKKGKTEAKEDSQYLFEPEYVHVLTLCTIFFFYL